VLAIAGVEDDRVEAALAGVADADLDRGGGDHRVALGLERGGPRTARVGVGGDDEDGRLAAHRSAAVARVSPSVHPTSRASSRASFSTSGAIFISVRPGLAP
jgi:hypothetical protein